MEEKIDLGRSRSAAGKATILATGILGVLFSVAGVAWACTSQVSILTLSPTAGPPGATVTVRGQGVASQGPVDIRWNTLTGPRLAQANADGAGNFSASVVVPADAVAGVHPLMVISNGAGVGRAAVDVTSTAAVSGAPAASSPAATQPNVAPWALRNSVSANRQPATFAFGAVLLAVGLVTLLAAFTVAVTRRRRIAALGRTRQ